MMSSTVDDYQENSISLCPVKLNHKDFLLQLFKECRPDLDLIVGINEKQKEAILLHQFSIEEEQLIKMYPEAEFNIVLLNEEPIGRLYIYYDETTYRILEIGLLEQYRSMGIGRILVTKVIGNASKKGKIVSLQVAWFNKSAYGFYEELGFKIVENRGVSYEMHYIP